MHCGGQWKHKLTQAAAQPTQGFAKQTKQRMPGLVKRQIDVIENRHKIETGDNRGSQNQSQSKADEPPLLQRRQLVNPLVKGCQHLNRVSAAVSAPC